MSNQHLESLLDDADRIVATDLYPARCRTVIANLAAALRIQSSDLVESREYGMALAEEIIARTVKHDQFVAMANSMHDDFVNTVEALGTMPEGYCFCSENRIGDDSKTHEPECAELQALRDARTARTGDRATDFDNDAVYQFSKLMKDKMAKSRAKGRKGWNDPTQCSPDFLRHLLYEHIYKGDPVDVANLCMMLRHYDEPTTPKPEDDLRLLHTEAAEAELAALRAQVERMTGALTIAANRLHRCSVDYDTGTREFIEVGGWADEARAALTEGAAP